MRACARAPVRVDLAGGGTDAPPYCLEHGGAVVNIAVQRHVYASVQRLTPGSGVIIRALDLNDGVVADEISALATDDHLALLKALLLRLVPPEDSVLLLTESDVPPGSGLGGSGALGVAVVAAIDHAYGRSRTAWETAALANEIERQDLGYPGGDQDSYGTALGGINFFQYHPGGGMTPRKLDVSADMRCALQQHSLLIYTGAAHVSASIHEEIQQSYALECSPTLQALQALENLAREVAQALEDGNLHGYAVALGQACGQLYRLHDRCDSPELRRYFAAIEDCIIGGKTCGAGGGGSILVYTKAGRRSECIRRVKELGGLVWPVIIDSDGLTTWREPPVDSAEMQSLSSGPWRSGKLGDRRRDTDD